MDTPDTNRVSTLTVSDNPSIGSPWIGLHAPMPKRLDNDEPSMQPLIDIYAEILRLHEKLDEQSLALTTIIEEHRRLPWVRLYSWLSNLFSRGPQ